MADDAQKPAFLLGMQLDAETFLREYWQKKPLLIHQGLPDFHDPLSADELAGLACEEEVESRMVVRHTGPGTRGWELRTGPFSERDFTCLPEHDWTLLVQAVDQWVPELRDLLACVDFLPRWRLDDIMVSYAEPGGGVGPHFDYYDVFIVQGTGSRLWQTGQHCDSRSPLRRDGGLKILEQFAPSQEWLLHSGDVLYIPPGVAHNGIAQQAGLSYSIGFRAPSVSEALLGYTDLLSENLSEDQRYGDPGLSPCARPGEIPPQALADLERLIHQALSPHPRALALWFGRHMTEPRYPELRETPEQPLSSAELGDLLSSGRPLVSSAGSRFAYTQLADELLFFADGGSLALDAPSRLSRDLVLLLSEAAGEQTLSLQRFGDSPESLDLLTQLYNQGSLVLQED